MTTPNLQPDQPLLHYRITAKIGEGGMGEVYRATDTDLNRDVALKVLPAALADDPERLARFEREARLLASLNHPHIATIHGLHQADRDGRPLRFLVMELVEGEELTLSIERGVPFERAIEIAVQIARALEAAHGAGIVHRDLKPANVKLTAEHEVKVLDFGLAKAVGVETESGSGTTPAMSPTITSAGTVAGTILGTAAYMSPEQARGRPVDRRADMWAFGSLLYELLTGQRAFPGETISDTLASVLKETPDWSALPPRTPAGIRRLLRRCLEKDQRRRWSDAADARLELEEAMQPTPEDEAGAPATAAAADAAPPRSAALRLAPWLLAAAALLLAVFAFIGGGSDRPAPRDLLRLSIPLGEGLRVEDEQTGNVAISPDGRHIALSMIEEEGRSALYLRTLSEPELVRLEGTASGENPLFSPDGKWIAFFAGNSIRKIPVAGGPPVEVCEQVGSPRGATWTEDDRIVFPRHFDTGLWQVPASGGAPTELTSLDPEHRERTHRWPSVIPGRDVVLFTVATLDSPENYEDARIDAVDLNTGERTPVFEGASAAFYAGSGHLIFARDGSLWAVAFDEDTLRTTGTPIPVQAEVMGVRNSGVVFASLARDGLLAYVPGRPEGVQRQVRWRHLDGRTSHIEAIAPGAILEVELSPDGKKVAVSLASTANYDIWVYDLQRENRIRITYEGDNTNATWSPDGRYIYYTSERDASMGVYRMTADGSGEPELMWAVDGISVTANDVSDDGRLLLMTYFGPQPSDLYTLDLTDPGAEPQPLLDSPAVEDLARFSPDGKWLAYTTDESGDFEVLVRPVSGAGGRWQISNGAGVVPRWSRDGRQLYYRTGRRLFAVDVEAVGETLRVGNPRLVFDDLDRTRLTTSYDLSPAGDAILEPVALQAETPPDEIAVLVNWLDEVKRVTAGQ